MGRYWIAGLTAIALLFLADPAHADFEGSETFETYGDIMQYVLPLSAFASTYIAKDKVGRIQFVKAGAVTMGTVSILKVTQEKWRPNAGNAQSFPSGHTAGAFWGASFIGTRYGAKWGVPAYILAGLVGVSRIDSQNHFTDDVVSGMSIALFSNWWITTPMNSTVALMPIASNGNYGMSLSFGGGIGLADPDALPAGWQPRFRYDWEWGASLTERIEVTAPTATGTTFDIADSITGSEEQITAHVSLEFLLTDRHEVMLRFFPWEVRDVGISPDPIRFAGVTFPPNTVIESAYRVFELKARWRFDLVPREDRWNFKLGLGMTWQDMETTLFTATLWAEVEDTTVLPIAHAHVSFKITPKLKVILEGDGMAFGSDHTIDGALLLRYQIDKQWDVSLGYRIWARRTSDAKVTNDMWMHRGVIGLGYAW
ncbi:MAG: phosphatase PAP2 family protein [Planctomycetota bacterium]|jgi:hypothetical protein